MSIEEAVLEKLRILPSDKQQEVLNFIESLEQEKIGVLTENELEKADEIIARGLTRAMNTPSRSISAIWVEFEAIRTRIAASQSDRQSLNELGDRG